MRLEGPYASDTDQAIKQLSDSTKIGKHARIDEPTKKKYKESQACYV